ncbi:hypothetical protein [Harryflintia acetispora]|uniref:hypothetical protein n=1 Tax=Harryflintia acetispora TaxID=1849041 RepID=UPI00189756A7|nr:hypothetical protein [Harryflintia acetispora]
MKKLIVGVLAGVLSLAVALPGAAAKMRSTSVRLDAGSEEQVTGGVVLESWQWPQKDRLLLAFTREGVEEPQRVIAQLNVEEGLAGSLYSTAKKGELGFKSRLYDGRMEFLLGENQFSLELPDGGVLRTERADFYGDYLPEFKGEYFYQGVQFNSSEEYYFCERMARGLGMKGEAVCDKLMVYSNRGDNQGEEIAMIGFPFQVKGNEKNMRWMRASDRILVQAKVYLPQEYGSYETQYYVYNAPSATLISKFTLKENDLVIQDTYKSKILLLSDSQEPVLYLYDYREKKLQELDRFTRPVQARFSPDGTRAAVIREKRSFVPTIYELES